MKLQIKSRWSSAVRFECELDASFESESYGVQLCAAVKLAIKARANLTGANLTGAYLAGANLADANLADANLVGANLVGAYLADAYLADANGEKLTLVGKRPAIWFGPIGSAQRTVYAFQTDRGVYVRAGCFFDTLDAFRAKVIDTHGINEHAREYEAFVVLAECHFDLFPAEVKKSEAA
jgi:hypothetical protein